MTARAKLRGVGMVETCSQEPPRWRRSTSLRLFRCACDSPPKIHVLGGGNSKSTIADHDVFDPAKNAWSAAARLPRAEGSPAAVAFDGKLYASGGRSGPSDFGAVDIYNPATNAWSEGPKIRPRGTAGAVVYCDAVYQIDLSVQRDR